MPTPILRPLQLDSADARAELIRQRKLCGWNYEDARIDEWFDLIRKDEMTLYWIYTVPDGPPMGHVSLCRTDYQGDLSLADPAAQRVTLATLWLDSSLRRTGMGKATVREVERLAREQLGARSITINTMPDDVAFDEELYRRHGTKPHHTFSVESYYQTLGYKPYKREARYHVDWPDGEHSVLEAIFMEKML